MVLADSDTDDYPVGRALRLVDGHVGRFGWKAQTTTLGGFVRAACANELGLGNPSQPQPVSMAKRDYKAPGLDLTNEQCDQLTAYVGTLGHPVEEVPDSPAQARQAAEGKKRFDLIGCSDCHKQDVGPAKGIYSDLLLHRMGQTLVGGGTYGDLPPNLPDFAEGGAPQSSEWRTPPLWGVADSAPYLHDGRAADLNQAIELHAGQAKSVADKYKQLKWEQKEELLAFLRTLRAPKSAERDSQPQLSALRWPSSDSCLCRRRFGGTRRVTRVQPALRRMAIDVVCECGKRLKAPDWMAGRSTQCPACWNSVSIPRPRLFGLLGPAKQKRGESPRPADANTPPPDAVPATNSSFRPSIGQPGAPVGDPFAGEGRSTAFIKPKQPPKNRKTTFVPTRALCNGDDYQPNSVMLRTQPRWVKLISDRSKQQWYHSLAFPFAKAADLFAARLAAVRVDDGRTDPVAVDGAG